MDHILPMAMGRLFSINRALGTTVSRHCSADRPLARFFSEVLDRVFVGRAVAPDRHRPHSYNFMNGNQPPKLRENRELESFDETDDQRKCLPGII